MKKLIFTLLLAAFSLSTFAMSFQQDTTGRQKQKPKHKTTKKKGTTKKDTSTTYPVKPDTTRKTY